jgi:hypothetical protein
MFGAAVSCRLSCAADSGVVLRKGLISVVVLLTAGTVAGCGGSGSSSKTTASNTGTSSSAQKLLVKTFGGHHEINSGVISLDIKIVPAGSSTITQPIELSFGGPFSTSAAGQLPESDFTIGITGQGQHGSLQLISTGGKGYVSVSGQSYMLPASSFKSIESQFGSLAGSDKSSGSTAGAGLFAKLGIQPLDWLADPQIVTTSATIDGVATTHVHAHVDTTAMLRDVNKLLGKAGSVGVSGIGSLPKSISPATQARIATTLGTPSFDVWTGNSDNIVRKLTVASTIPVTGQVSSLLGGMTSAKFTLSFGYSDINKPQTITAPTEVKPYSVFQAKVGAILQTIESGLVTGSLTGGTSTNSGGGTATGIPDVDQKYTACITKAAGDVKKMQKCSSLLGSG